MQKESAVEVRLLNQRDLAAAMRLKGREQWNQTGRDWQRYGNRSRAGTSDLIFALAGPEIG